MTSSLAHSAFQVASNAHAAQPLAASGQAAQVWLCDDDESMRFVLAHALKNEGLAIQAFENADAVLAALQEGPAPKVLISDIRMAGTSGLVLLEHMVAHHPQTKVVIMTAFSDLDSAVSSFSKGAFEYLAKPFDLQEAMSLVRRALASSKLAAAEEEGARASSGRVISSANVAMIGQASAMQELFRAIGRLAHSHATILITGETGTGKERVAHALHTHSPRAREAFVAINTAAIAKDLLESELFGHERGAFTGAQAQRKGRFEQASGGTLFLDEIGDMPLELQTSLLRVLSEGVFYRVGGTQAIRCDVRVIAATHQDLEQRVAAGLFREDLFHRLNVIRLRIPPLRERVEDIPLLADHFLRQAALHNHVEARQLSASALQCLARYPFRGNVRELENICQWLTIMAPSNFIEVVDLPPEVQNYWREQGAVENGRLQASQAPVRAAQMATESAMQPQAAPLQNTGTLWQRHLHEEALRLLRAQQPDVWETLMHHAQLQIIQAALEITEGNRSLAAQALGIGRNTIARKLGTT